MNTKMECMGEEIVSEFCGAKLKRTLYGQLSKCFICGHTLAQFVNKVRLLIRKLA